MPEYLSPAVYVEEVSSGARPIEGVSTSTAGMVGVTERGPENIPVLCTGIGDYRRIFGGDLNLRDFTDPTGRIHGHTYQAAKAFFENDGRRVFVTRVVSPDAERADRVLYDRGTAASTDTLLLRSAPQDSGTAVNTPLAYALENLAPLVPLAVNTEIRIGDGSRSEYREITALGPEIHVALNAPLQRAHAAATTVEEVDRVVDTSYAAGVFRLVGDVAVGALSITVVTAPLPIGNPADAATLLGLPGDAVFEIGTPPRSEYRTATAAEDLGGGQVRLTLSAALALDHADAGDVAAIELPVGALTTQTLITNAGGGDRMIYLDSLGGGFPAAPFPPGTVRLIVLDRGTANQEVRRLGSLGQVTLDSPAYAPYPAGTRLDVVAMTDDDLTIHGAGTQRIFTVESVAGLAVGMEIVVDGNAPTIIDALDDATNQVTTRTDALPANPAGGEAVVPAEKKLTATATAGMTVIALDNRLGLQAGDVLRVGTGANAEYVAIAQVMGTRRVAPDAGSVLLAAALAEIHSTGDTVRRQTPPIPDPARPPVFTLTGLNAGATDLLGTDATALAAGEVLAASLSGGLRFFHEVAAVNTGLAGVQLTLDEALDFSHDLGAAVVGRDPLIEVYALDRGAWGNRLRIAVRAPQTAIVQANLTGSSALNPLVQLSNYTGIEPGTVLEYFDPATGSVVGGLSKVIRVDRAAGEVELAAVPDPAVTGSAIPLAVRSREFEIQVFLLRQPDPAVPSRNDTIIDSETFVVTMDPRHSRYIHKVIGTTWVPGADVDDDGDPLRNWDRRSEGESGYIRVRDVAAGNLAVTHGIRLGPEPLQDVLVTGVIRAARLPLAGGVEAVASMSDAMYQGVDSNEPRLRTGIHALQNETTISILAVPGQFTAPVQQSLINHCERDRYRFAVLDGPAPTADTLVDVQLMRQQFDTNYAAIYHPWVTIPDPMPGNLASIQQIPMPPSGHVMGIFARTDNERGVHKAPANEVVRNISGLARYLNQREQDILNPFPTNINVIRDFRRANRGIRVWGARCITSDSQFKYVNVRRLLIFVEKSIEIGLQHVVFEPNAEPLWARVRRSIGNFLTVVWRNGALEGTSAEQAFFVKCDRTTMTETDIAEGRLIVLVGIAPVKPAEFVIVRIGLKTATAEE